MKALIETLKTIISTNMLGESVSWLAQNLNYKGRTSIYRIKDGTATMSTVREICKRLYEYQHLTENDLLNIEATIKNVEYFNRLIRKEMNRKHPDWIFQAILPFIVDFYDYFSPEFQKKTLPIILQLKKDNPEAFFYTLAYFYIKYTYSNFYSIADTHQERCHKVAERLGRHLAEVDPGNIRGMETVSKCGRGFIFDIEAPTMWKVVEHVANIIQIFADPAAIHIGTLKTILLPELDGRTYWQGDNRDKIIVLQPVETVPGCGAYVLLSLETSTLRLSPLFRIYFYDETSLSIENLDDSTSKLGFYTLSDTALSLEWEHPEDNPTGFGNSWKKIDILQNTVLNRFDKTISVSEVCGLALRKDGWEPLEGFKIKDVVISREIIKIILINDLSITIPRDKFPKLSQITSDTQVVFLRHIASDTIYITWPTIGLAIPYNKSRNPIK